MGAKLKHYFYSTYWLVGIAMLSIIAYFAYRSESANFSYYISLGAAVLSGMYFVQKQKLEEDKLFFEAFISFNARFSELNPLLRILPKTAEITPEKEDVIAKYFDLCAEEYYYYKHGRLPEDVWVAWAKGTLFYIHRYPCIKDYWDNLEQSDSSYGMTRSGLEEVVGEK